MFYKKITTALAIVAMCSTSATAAGFLGKQYLTVGYQHGEFGNSKDSDLLDYTKGGLITYNHPIVEKIDIGGTVEYNWADGRDNSTGSLTNVDYNIGGSVSYVTLYNTVDEPLKFFISPQLGVQRERREYKKSGWKKSSTDTDLYFGFEGGFEYQIRRFTLTQSVGVSHTNDTDMNTRASLGFDVTERVVFIVGGDYQLNDDNDYTLKTGLVVRF